MSLTLTAAQAMIERARAQATSIDVPMNLAVTDGGGHLLAFARMDGIADTSYRWHDDAVKFTHEADIRANFEIMQGQHDPQEMIDKMVEVIGADDGKYRNVWPPSTEELIKQVQEDAWSRTVQPLPAAAGV